VACRLHAAAGVQRVSRFRLAGLVLLSLFVLAGDAGAGRQAQPAAGEVGSKDGVEMRRFLRDLVAAAGVSEARQPTAMRKVFKWHPAVARWVIEGRDPDQLLAEAGLDSFKSAALGDQGVEQMAQAALGAQSALALLRALPIASLPQADLERAIATGIDAVPDSHWHRLAREVDGAVADFKLTRTGAISMLNDPDSRIEIPDLPPRQAARLQRLIQDYFDSLPVEDKRAMLMATLALHPKATTAEQLAAVLHSTGPVAQKLFQLLGRNARSPVVRDVMNELKSAVKPFPDGVARKIVARNLRVDVDQEFSEFVRVGSATTGQVYRARLRSTGRLVAIKVLRPGIHAKAAREIEALRSLATGTFETDLVETLARKIGEELDLVIEGRNIDRGQSYNRRHSGVVVPERVRQFAPTRDVLVVSFAEGSGLDRPVAGATPHARGLNLVRRGRALVRVLETVMEEGLSSGFVHADLHGGNLFESDWRPGESKLALLDWGSVVELSLPQRRGFAGLGIGLAARSPRQVVAALDEITPMSAGKQREVLAAITPLLRKPNTVDKRLSEVLGKAIELDVRVPEGVTGFARTQTFLLGQISDLNQELDRVDPGGRLERFDPGVAAGWAGYKVGARDLALGLANRISFRGITPARIIPGADRPPMVDVDSLARAMGRTALDAPGAGGQLASDAARIGKKAFGKILRRRPPPRAKARAR
jgi:predicted unusual protein kinase regulating ubiquinone biosynthesis (AarF/ABC1/UbiB family)